MKKIIALLLAFIILLTLVSCVGDSADSGKANNTDGKKNEDNVNDKQNDKENSELGIITEEIVRNHAVTPASDFVYEKTEGGIKILKYTDDDPIVYIPSTIDGLPVVEVKAYLFSNDSHVRGVYFPDTVKELSYTFINNDRVEVVICEGVERLCENVFFCCVSLHTLLLGDDLCEIGKRTIFGCLELEEVYISPKVTNLDAKIHPINAEACPKLTVRGESGSYIEQYCKDNNIPFKAE